MSRHLPRQTLACAAAALALAVASSGNAEGAASGSVYRCKQANGAIAYQDFPCKGGVAVDIKPDAADPHAIERLRREQAEFERSYAQRRAAEAAQQRRDAVRPLPEPLPPEVENGYEQPQETPVYLFYGPVARMRFDHPVRRAMHRLTPKPPAHVSPAGMRPRRRLQPS